MKLRTSTFSTVLIVVVLLSMILYLEAQDCSGFNTLGCTVEQYEQQATLTEGEIAKLTCRDIDAQRTKLDDLLVKLEKGEDLDNGPVGYLATGGMRGRVDRVEAMEMATQRRHQLVTLFERKQCITYTTSLRDR